MQSQWPETSVRLLNCFMKNCAWVEPSCNLFEWMQAAKAGLWPSSELARRNIGNTAFIFSPGREPMVSFLWVAFCAANWSPLISLCWVWTFSVVCVISCLGKKKKKKAAGWFWVCGWAPHTTHRLRVESWKKCAIQLRGDLCPDYQGKLLSEKSS